MACLITNVHDFFQSEYHITALTVTPQYKNTRTTHTHFSLTHHTLGKQHFTEH